MHTSPGCGAPAPFVCDYDGDGKRDLLVGTGQEGYVYFYRNTNTDAAPILAPGVLLKVGASPLTVTNRATPFIYDWDGDGLKDLLCGNGDGWVFFFKNIGTAQAPAYAAGTHIQAGGTNLNLGIRSVVRMFDWDGDGVKDLVGSSDTGVYWCKNIGSDSAPILQAPVALRAPVSGSGLVADRTIGPRMRLDLVDWNNDGAIDLLGWQCLGEVTYYEGYRFAFSANNRAAPRSAGRQWNSAPYPDLPGAGRTFGAFDHEPGRHQPALRWNHYPLDELRRPEPAVLPPPNWPMSLKAALPRRLACRPARQLCSNARA